MVAYIDVFPEISIPITLPKRPRILPMPWVDAIQAWIDLKDKSPIWELKNSNRA